MPSRALTVVDFDGTLLRSDGSFHPADLAALAALGEEGVLRVVATGRSPFSLRRALAGRRLPVDRLVLSSGAALAGPDAERLLEWTNLAAADVARAAAVLEGEGLDYMIHSPFPDNHHFAWRAAGPGTPDFLRRIRLYPDHSRPLLEPPSGFGPAAQLLGVAAGAGAEAVYDRVREALPGLSVIRATSPIDHASLWIEVFPGHVSKSGAVARLAAREGARAGESLAIGNDWNDLDLLRWAGTAYVVANAPADLRAEFPVVAGHDDGGVAEAIRRWREARGRAAG